MLFLERAFFILLILLFAAGTLWFWIASIPVFALLAFALFWRWGPFDGFSHWTAAAARRVTRENGGHPGFHFDGESLLFQFDPRRALDFTRSVSQWRRIALSGSIWALGVGLLLLLVAGIRASLQPHDSDVLAGCGLYLLLLSALDLYPQRNYLPLSALLFTHERSISPAVMSGVLNMADLSEVALPEWHPSYFAFLRDWAHFDKTPQAQAAVQDWLFYNEVLHGNTDAAEVHLLRRLELQDNTNSDHYISHGQAVFFYEVLRRDRARALEHSAKIENLDWDLPVHIPFIDAAIALTKDDSQAAARIARAELESNELHGNSASVKLHRAILQLCLDRALAAGAN